MSFDSFKEVAESTVRKGLRVGHEYSPEILTISGVAGLVASGVLAARATLKLEGVVGHAERRLAELNAKRDHEGVTNAEVAKVYAHNATDLVKLYGPSATLALLSIFSILSANHIMRTRNVGLIAAYKAIETTLSNYRQRVIDEYGEEKDRDYMDGVYRTTETDPETGKKKKIVTYGSPANEEYVFTFGEGNQNWQRNFPDQNVFFLKVQEGHATDRLRSRGFLVLNDVLETVGLPHTTAGAVVGWVLGEEGDDFVDFGINNWANIHEGARQDGREGHIRLNFNVQGLISDRIDLITKR